MQCDRPAGPPRQDSAPPAASAGGCAATAMSAVDRRCDACGTGASGCRGGASTAMDAPPHCTPAQHRSAGVTRAIVSFSSKREGQVICHQTRAMQARQIACDPHGSLLDQQDCTAHCRRSFYEGDSAIRVTASRHVDEGQGKHQHLLGAASRPCRHAEPTARRGCLLPPAGPASPAPRRAAACTAAAMTCGQMTQGASWVHATGRMCRCADCHVCAFGTSFKKLVASYPRARCCSNNLVQVNPTQAMALHQQMSRLNHQSAGRVLYVRTAHLAWYSLASCCDCASRSATAVASASAARATACDLSSFTCT